MKAHIKIHPNSSQEKIEKTDNCSYNVWLREKPIDNKANISLMKVLNKYFGKRVKIKSGFTSRNKIIEIGD